MRKQLRAEPRVKIQTVMQPNGRPKATFFERTGPTTVGSGDALPYRAASVYGRGEEMAQSNPGGNASILGAGEMLRARGRDLYRQTGKAKGPVDSLIAELIGPGFSMIPATGDKVFDAEIAAMIAEWEAQADFYGLTNFDGVLTAAERGAFIAGDSFVQFMRSKYAGDGIVPLQLKGIESEFCPLSETMEMGDGLRSVMGIILDQEGRKQGYRMYREHPEDWVGLAGMHNQELITVPKEQILHRLWNGRPGQLRGESGLAQAIIYLYGSDFYFDNELVRKQNVSKLSLVIQRAAQEGGSFADAWAEAQAEGDVEYQQEDGTGQLKFAPGDAISLEPGETAQVFPTADVGGSYEPFVKHVDRTIAKAIGVLYEHVSEDWSSGNDRMHKSARNHHERRMEGIQYTQIVPQFIRPTYRTVIDTAVLAGIIRPPRGMSDKNLHAAMFVPSEWSYVHPVQEETARQKRLEMGISSREREVAGMGERLEDVDAERAADIERERESEADKGKAMQGKYRRGAIYDDGAPVFAPKAASKLGWLKRKFGLCG